MKTLIITTLLFSSLAISQTVNDSTQLSRRNQDREQLRNQNSEIKTMQEQIGPRENQEITKTENRKKKDVFIDKDGDGICDSRQSGMSFNKMRKRYGSGQQGPGKGQRGNDGGNGNRNGNGH